MKLALVGCGGMGMRHLHGLNELRRYGLSPWELVAVCDVEADRGEEVADRAAEFFGSRPRVFTRLSALIEELHPDAVDVVTTVKSHHGLVTEALAGGVHVMVEKPLAITMKASRKIEAAAANSGKTVSVAENYRRDPMNRLVKAVIDTGILGPARLLIETRLSPGGEVFITTWRHDKAAGGILLDVAVHYADILQYFLSPPKSVVGHAALLERQRDLRRSESKVSAFYDHVNRDVDSDFAVTAEDSAVGLFDLGDGCFAQWTLVLGAGRGEPTHLRKLYFEYGSIACPPDRSGQEFAVSHGGAEKPIVGEDVLDLAPDFHLDRPAAILFGGDRLGGYDFPFNETDRKITALEYLELSECVDGRATPEVGIAEGRMAMAIVYGLFESSEAGRSIHIADVIDGKVDAYQFPIDGELGIE